MQVLLDAALSPTQAPTDGQRRPLLMWIKQRKVYPESFTRAAGGRREAWFRAFSLAAFSSHQSRPHPSSFCCGSANRQREHRHRSRGKPEADSHSRPTWTGEKERLAGQRLRPSSLLCCLPWGPSIPQGGRGLLPRQHLVAEDNKRLFLSQAVCPHRVWPGSPALLTPPPRTPHQPHRQSHGRSPPGLETPNQKICHFRTRLIGLSSRARRDAILHSLAWKRGIGPSDHHGYAFSLAAQRHIGWWLFSRLNCYYFINNSHSHNNT